jgi:small-conductance mechanosensitive channel
VEALTFDALFVVYSELKLQNKGKEIELKDFKAVKVNRTCCALANLADDVCHQAKQIELLEELQEYKIKIEKLPILLAEVARLRGSSRAAVKALTEQDKIITDLKGRVKKLEREATRLQGDNRSLMDVEHKLKEANAEIAKLMTVCAALQPTIVF